MKNDMPEYPPQHSFIINHFPQTILAEEPAWTPTEFLPNILKSIQSISVHGLPRLFSANPLFGKTDLTTLVKRYFSYSDVNHSKLQFKHLNPITSGLNGLELISNPDISDILSCVVHLHRGHGSGLGF
jgi:hypothetical protein